MLCHLLSFLTHSLTSYRYIDENHELHTPNIFFVAWLTQSRQIFSCDAFGVPCGRPAKRRSRLFARLSGLHEYGHPGGRAVVGAVGGGDRADGGDRKQEDGNQAEEAGEREALSSGHRRRADLAGRAPIINGHTTVTRHDSERTLR